jgi:hypothetical protein
MAEASYPFENVDVTESQFSFWARNFQETGIQGAPTGTELEVSAEGSTLSIDVAVGQAFIRGHYYTNSTIKNIAVPTAGINTRIDLVVLELDPTLNKIEAKLILGEAVSSSPVAPTLVQTDTGIYQLHLATLTIPNSTLAITSEMLVDWRTFMSHRIGVWTTATRPADPVANQTFGFNFTLMAHEFWDGAAWLSLADPISEEGDLIAGGPDGLPSRVAIGTIGQILKSDGTTLSWQDPPSVGGGLSDAFLLMGA